MKTVLFVIFALVGVSASAAPQRLVAVQGSARVMNLSGTIEVLIKGRAVSAHSDLGVENATAQTENGFMAVTRPDLGAKNCRDGVYVVTAEEGNFFPMANGTEIYKAPSIVSFNCINE